MKKRSLWLLLSILVFCDLARAQGWQQKNGDHFIIQYPDALSQQWAHDVLRAADGYYDSIARRIDYSRYHTYWSWDDRVKIIVFPTQEIFLKETGQPAWSQGGAVHRRWPQEERQIVTFYQEEGFLDSLLPHEISHLILLDFIGVKGTLPIWFNEGVAQLHEKSKPQQADELMRNLVQRGIYIPFATLAALDIREETQPLAVAVFYAQSLSVVNFMIERFGSRRFGALCRVLGEGKAFEEALASAYPGEVSTLAQLEKNWLSYMKK
jgi:hypothetical protein